ncbi:MAG: hypothetical protein ACXAC7_16330 [Candidatus Hodarchaeales archaeon]|jgi:hypothetical protein
MESTDEKRIKILTYDRQIFQGVLYIVIILFLSFLSLVTLFRTLEEESIILGIVGLLGLFGVFIIFYLMFRAFFDEKQFLQEGNYLIHRRRFSEENDEDRYLISSIEHIVLGKEIQEVVNQLFIVSWLSKEKIWTIGLRMKDQKKYWIYADHRIKVQKYVKILSNAPKPLYLTRDLF